MTARNDLDAEVWRRIDDVGYSHHFVVWMIVMELEKEGIYPVNGPAIRKRMFRWTGQYQTEDRVDTSIKRLQKHGLIERDEVEEWPYGKHNRTTPEGLEIARQVALKWLRLLECENRADLREIEPETVTGTDASEAGGE